MHRSVLLEKRMIDTAIFVNVKETGKDVLKREHLDIEILNKQS